MKIIKKFVPNSDILNEQYIKWFYHAYIYVYNVIIVKTRRCDIL